MTPLIETRGVSKHYGAFRALDDISIAVRAGEFVSIVGPNGAGKTTLVNLLTGLLVPSKGEVYFKGRNIAGVGPVALATRGMARTFQLVQARPSSRARASSGGSFPLCSPTGRSAHALLRSLASSASRGASRRSRACCPRARRSCSTSPPHLPCSRR
jgi:energy-coupling factor transporter ATP-binding protein EcfA2